MTEEEKRIEIRDSVVMGDVNQHVLNTECPICSTSNVKVMKCQEIQCGTKFCELCHPECRSSNGSSFRFDSGKGLGPFCRKCIIAKREKVEKEERQRLARIQRERVEREERAEKVRIKEDYVGLYLEERAEKERRKERERVEREERAEKEQKERKREEEGIRKRARERVEREESRERRDKAWLELNQKKAEAKRLEWEGGRVERELESESSKLWKTAEIHASIQNDIHKKRLMYSLLLGVLVTILFEALIDVPRIGENTYLLLMRILAVVMGTLCFFYPLYLIIMIIICWLTGTKKHYVKLLNRANIIHDYNIMVEELSLLTVAELRDKLSEVGLPVDGNKKADLIPRLADYEVRTKEGLL